MMREEAIKILQHLAGIVSSEDYQETFKMAISALSPVSRERVEKVWRGEWITPTIIGGRAFNIPHCSVCNGVPCGTDENTKFCAHCGAPMTDEAVEILVKRMEEMRND